jgi:hypothetical protein
MQNMFKHVGLAKQAEQKGHQRVVQQEAEVGA